MFRAIHLDLPTEFQCNLPATGCSTGWVGHFFRLSSGRLSRLPLRVDTWHRASESSDLNRHFGQHRSLPDILNWKSSPLDYICAQQIPLELPFGYFNTLPLGVVLAQGTRKTSGFPRKSTLAKRHSRSLLHFPNDANRCWLQI